MNHGWAVEVIRCLHDSLGSFGVDLISPDRGIFLTNHPRLSPELVARIDTLYCNASSISLFSSLSTTSGGVSRSLHRTDCLTDVVLVTVFIASFCSFQICFFLVSASQGFTMARPVFLELSQGRRYAATPFLLDRFPFLIPFFFFQALFFPRRRSVSSTSNRPPPGIVFTSHRFPLVFPLLSADGIVRPLVFFEPLSDSLFFFISRLVLRMALLTG